MDTLKLEWVEKSTGVSLEMAGRGGSRETAFHHPALAHVSLRLREGRPVFQVYVMDRPHGPFFSTFAEAKACAVSTLKLLVSEL